MGHENTLTARYIIMAGTEAVMTCPTLRDAEEWVSQRRSLFPTATIRVVYYED